MAFKTLLKLVRVRFSPSSNPKTALPASGNAKKKHQNLKLAMLVQTLKLTEKVAEASGVPHLKGALALALEVAQCVEVQIFTVL
jgi:hypothetical protein